MRSSTASSSSFAALFHLRRMLAGPRRAGGGASPASALTAVAEGPSCLFVGPIETASKEMLEALYRQARVSYYGGKPLVVDDMFDKVELKLRLYGSKSVIKYPRCSLKRQSTYADAEEDQSLVLALASVWSCLLVFGASAFIIPTIYSIKLGLRDAFGYIYPLDALRMLSDMLLVGLGYLIGFPISSASVKALEGLWRNNLVALKGSCPNCGEEVFAFVKTNDKSRQTPHRAECHVCLCSLEYRTKVEKSLSGTHGRWVYGRVYLLREARSL